MKYLDFYREFSRFTIFSLNDIRKVDQKFHPRQLISWQKKGYLIQLLRGYYMFADVPLDEALLILAANTLYTPSYVSLYFALAYYQLIPESVFTITSITTKKTNIHTTPIGTFSYTSIKPSLFFGYTLIPWQGRMLAIAHPEKAIIDTFYSQKALKTRDDIQALRFDREQLHEHIKHDRLDFYNNQYPNQRVQQLVHYLKDLWL